ncbi:MAG: 1-deoxy-D-xylulose-5-phosphate synthase [Acidobacteria bacterium]|nr:MAG: 1-deoxy-D-xylulose-5-phosphate synthase [Acidobacteriota bacterium]
MIESLDELKALDENALNLLAHEIRLFLIDSVSKTGGHLGPNLGVVELTIAIHRVFDSPRDPIIWDTGHQAYVHKILTGRAGRFDTLRQAGGLSGYPNRAESPHDLIENSHASGSLAYAAGLAKTAEGKVVVVIGDGALTGGVALEALNNIGESEDDILVILNDNGRSYQPTVGGLSAHLAHLRFDPRYRRAKARIENRLKEVPRIGDSLAREAKRVKQGLKQLVAPQVLFEDLGFYYAGPIDGHDIAELERDIRLAAEIEGPVLLHVVTEKGHGYTPAVEDELEKHHALGKFDPATGKKLPQAGRTWTAVFTEALCDAAEEHEEIVGITAAMASPTGIGKFGEKLPDRAYDVGIAEQYATTFAAGLAMGGLHPVVAVYSTFLQRAYDQVLLDVCLHGLPVTFVLDRAGITGDDGPSHHGIFDLTYLRAMPNMVIAAPRDEWELRDLFMTAVNHDGPFAIRFPKGQVPATPERPASEVPIGEWEVLREGQQALILATGKMVANSIDAAEKLAADGIEVSVVNCRYVKPMDPRLVEWAADSTLVVTAEDNVLTGGFGSGVAEVLGDAGVTVPVLRIGVPDRFLEHASQDIWFERLGLDAEGIASKVQEAVDR